MHLPSHIQKDYQVYQDQLSQPKCKNMKNTNMTRGYTGAISV